MSHKTNPFSEAGFVGKTLPVPATDQDPDLNVQIFLQHYKPPSSTAKKAVLLLHGHPQTHVIWSVVAPLLAATGDWEVVVPDNRGNGASSAPSPGEGHARYTKREMARDMVHVMHALGHESFFVVAHDRGGRIAHRMALDHPEKVTKLIILDIAPTLDMYNQTDQAFAKLYWHWFFLLQTGIAEEFILAKPEVYLEALVTRFPRTVAANDSQPAAEWRLQAYRDNMQSRANVVAMCEDYRASGPGGPDLTLDAQDRAADRKIQCPTTVLWGKHGVIQAMYSGGLDLWQACCQLPVRGEGLDTGHYVPEEAPERIVQEIKSFF